MEVPRIAIVGAGAVGLDLAANCISAGHDVTVIARGKTYDSLRQNGFAYTSAEKTSFIAPDEFTVVTNTAQAGTQDYVFLTVKVGGLLDIAPTLPPLFHDETSVISLTNGIPPWYSYGQDRSIGRFNFTRDPVRTFTRFVEPERIIGGTVARSANRDGPDPISLTHTSGVGHTLGEIDHSNSERLHKLITVLADSGLKVDISDNIHRDIWKKLLGNICVNPLSVITEQTIGEMLDDPAVFERMQEIVAEAKKVGVKLGVITPDDFELAHFTDYASEHLREHETSMLQDFRAGRELETGRIVHVITMLAALEGVDVPTPALLQVSTELKQKINLSREVPRDLNP